MLSKRASRRRLRPANDLTVETIGTMMAASLTRIAFINSATEPAHACATADHSMNGSTPAGNVPEQASAL